MVISDEARAERNAYLRAWRAKNRDKVRAANSAYWERKAANKNSSTTDNGQHKEHGPGVADRAAGQQIGGDTHRRRAAKADKLAFG